MTTIKNWSVGGDSFELGPECWACEFGTRDEITGQGLGATAEDARANALMQAAAPELLKALEALLNYENLGAYDRADAMKAARAAMAKARGGAA